MPDSPAPPPPEVTHAAMANAIRALAMDAVEKANSGHPGMPMGMADVATVLFTRFLKFDPAKAGWPDRDRFVLSAGHGSMLLYALLHLTGYPGMDMAQIERFRQLGSKTAGHPEFGHAPGIETTTGPLGQGLANAVGMAIAERLLAARFGSSLVDHRTYVIAGDGCLMEGISQEAISLAGHLRLSKLIVLFDDNHISIDGPTALATSEDQPARFRAAGWSVRAVDGHDVEAVAAALAAAQDSERPSLIACRTIIGKGAPTKQGTAATHGAALGAAEVAAARAALDWPYPPFTVPADILAAWRAAGARGRSANAAWQARLNAADAVQRTAFAQALAGELPAELGPAMAAYKQKLAAEKPKWATRKSSQMALEVINPIVPETIGGSADLTGSNNTRTGSLKVVTAGDFAARYIHWGVREHGMCAAMNGMALHGGVIPYGGTFLVFTDYCRPAIRLAALMGQRVIYVMTHDSIGLGEDGPTHQPVEHLAALRAIPNLHVFRPADAIETAECWELALATRDAPSLLALSRQDLAAVRLEPAPENLCARGGYELRPAAGQARASLIATGSEVEIALAAKEILERSGIGTRIVSMPSTTLFDRQDATYRSSVLRPDTVRVAIEAGIEQGWEKYVGERGGFVGMHGFGASAPYKELYKQFGITPEKVVDAVRSRI
ncbi:MAG TPA: transketolase [Candidatus Sulfotelmatobacter sp.]|nr:transketolase [Candidatus Sulfotelmatobacter sp.]